jgi:hypothetical protein
MPFLILLLNNILDVDDGFFEVAFGLLLGLWGTHEILIPEYIGSSIPIDAMIYILYALVIGEIVIVFIDELIINTAKHNVRITHIERSDFENEHVVIENLGIFAVDMTNWILFDQALNKFKFPVFVLSGKIRFSKKTPTSVTVWTKPEPVRDEAKLPGNNFYWGRKQDVWNNLQDTASLEDSKGNAIHTFAYYGRRKDDKVGLI